MASRIADFGTPAAFNHYAVGWAHAMDTPYQWTKQVASHWGGTRNGTIVHWPRGFAAQGEIRSQFHHVIDVAPTILEAAGLPHPTHVNGIQQRPLEGVSMAYTFADADAERPPRHAVLRDVLQPRHLPPGLDGRAPATRMPWDCRRATPPSTTIAGSCTRPTTGRRRTTSPRSSRSACAELQQLFLIEAAQVRRAAAGRPPRRALQLRPRRAARTLVRGTAQLLFGGMGRLTRELDPGAEEQVATRSRRRSSAGGRRRAA